MKYNTVANTLAARCATIMSMERMKKGTHDGVPLWRVKHPCCHTVVYASVAPPLERFCARCLMFKSGMGIKFSS